MHKQRTEVGVFILAKNEQQNIGRCLESLRTSSWDAIVLDSGSTDRTRQVAAEFDFAEVRDFVYTDHCTAYNQITSKLGAEYAHVVILDADMAVSEALQRELKALLSDRCGAPQVIKAEIQMCVEGMPLRLGSLCPPKAFVFAVGRSYFVSVGHGEALDEGIEPVLAKEKLRHDDRKSYASFLQSQARYSQNLVIRKAAGEISGRDRLRTTTPFLIFAVPFVSYFLKGGFLVGKSGALYALDRLIAEAIMYRQSLSMRHARSTEE